MVMIGIRETRRRVKALVKANPEFVYKEPDGGLSCVYFTKDGAPSCLVGQAFADELRAIGVGPDDDRNWTGVMVLDELPVTPKARKWLGNVQIKQDSKWQWQRALEYAESSHTED